MFGFRKRKPAPVHCPSNPGDGSAGKVAFTNGERRWVQAFDLVSIAASVLKERGYAVTNEKTWLSHGASGFSILPQIVGVQPLEAGGVHTVSTIQVNHPTLTPSGIFEYQHSTGDNVVESLSQGIDQWAQLDFVPLLEALQPEPKICMTMVMDFPAEGDRPARVRRAILGPVAHLTTQPPSTTEANPPEEHPFCACCLLTNTFEAFKSLIQGDGFYGLRLFAARDHDGSPQADCRVNGEDWEAGAEALRQYATKWPFAGYEFRKQYVVLQSIEKGDKRSEK
jgi:hypothetical protein